MHSRIWSTEQSFFGPRIEILVNWNSVLRLMARYGYRRLLTWPSLWSVVVEVYLVMKKPKEVGLLVRLDN